MTAAEGGAAGAAGGTPGGAGAPDDPQALVEQIERTREDLGNTIEALAAKMDVKARATERAAEVSGQVKERLTEARQEVAGKLGQFTSGLTGKAVQTRRSVTENGKTLLGTGQPTARQVTGRAVAVGTTAWNAGPVQRGARRAGRLADEHPVPVAVMAGTLLVAGCLTIRWSLRP